MDYTFYSTSSSDINQSRTPTISNGNKKFAPYVGWAVRVGEGQSLILKTSILKTKESGGKGGESSPFLGPERQWFTLWRKSAVRVRLSPTRELSRYKAI
ncbi:hypothetical protein F8388_005372 [Cannabis sativa]|uniref:Uncharacterized protein n=1 Tax=Cannabis sativa TaxID=3483 RepID=A0A7J6E2N0_CANSA|nr:hypothetical protein F8388_005372 [Cannabis sativa]